MEMGDWGNINGGMHLYSIARPNLTMACRDDKLRITREPQVGA